MNGSVEGGEDRQVVRRRQALVPAGGPGSRRPGQALRREARQCGWRRRGVRHPRVQHPGQHGREGLHHGRDVRRRRVRRGTDRVSQTSSTSTGGGRPGSCSWTASWSTGTLEPPAELRRGPDDLRRDLPVLLPAAGDLLRLSRHVHVSLPRGDDQPHAALLVPRAGAARGAARGEVRGGADRVGRDLRRRRTARVRGAALAARFGRSPGLLERRRHGTRLLVRDGRGARLRRLRKRLPGARAVRPQSHRPGRGAARLGGSQRHSPARRCRRSASCITCSRSVPCPRRWTATRRR